MQAKFQSNRALKPKLLKTQKQLWKKSNLERVKVGAISSKQKDTVLLKPFGRTEAGLKYKNRVFLYSRYTSGNLAIL